MVKKKDKRTNNGQQNTIQKTKDWTTRTSVNVITSEAELIKCYN
jgi:hypothetical protein